MNESHEIINYMNEALIVITRNITILNWNHLRECNTFLKT